MEVEVVAGQVGEAADREFDAVDAAERQRVAGHLHHHGVDALLEHHRQQRLQVGRLGRGQRARHVRPSMRMPTVPIRPATRSAARSPASTR